jgi:hypothetical protein
MSIWDIVAGPLIGIVNKLIPDKTAAAAAVAQLQQMAAAGEIQAELIQLQSVTVNQSNINQAEAGNASMFVAGWRPFIGWVCGAVLCCQYILRPAMDWAFMAFHYPIPKLPGVDDTLWQLMFGMLGLGAMRSYEKVQGVSTSKIAGK